MYNILVISQISIAGALIIKGLAEGFKALGNNIMMFDVRELDYYAVKSFKPDFAIGYDYAQFVHPEAEKIIKELNIPVIHYFADDPNSDFAHSGNKELIDKLKHSSGTVFCWDRQYLDTFKNKRFYLPLGVNPDLYTVNYYDKLDLDISFVGRPLTLYRQIVLSSIVINFPGKLNIYSYEKHFETSVKEIEKLELLKGEQLELYKNSYVRFLNTEKELAQVYSSSKIVLNITMQQGLSSMNYRVLEVLASGGFLLTDFKEDTAEYFKSNGDLVFYIDIRDMIEKIGFYLENEDQRVAIASHGKNTALQNHSFKQRAFEISEKLSDILT